MKSIYGHDRSGFALPTVLFGIVVMSALAVAALNVSGDTMRSGQAVRMAGSAFYAAESGLHTEWENASSYGLESLASGDSVDLGWQNRGDGSSYRAVFVRLDDGNVDTPVFGLFVEGKAPGATEGVRSVATHFTYMNGVQKFDAAMKIRGRLRMDNGTSVDGADVDPPVWHDDAGENRCSDITHEDKTGVMMQDSTELDMNGSSSIDGNPRLVQDSMINDATFQSSGQLDWSELMATADHSIGCYGCGKLTFHPRATTVTDPVTGNEVCDTSDPYNWGSEDPSHPCYDYFPVIKIQGGGALMDGGDEYGQAIIVVDGAELDIENPMTFAGIIMSRGCHEIDDRVYGAIVHDQYPGSQCAQSEQGVYLDDSTADVHYSTCAVTRALEHSSANVVLGSSWDLIAQRAFNQSLR